MFTFDYGKLIALCFLYTSELCFYVGPFFLFIKTSFFAGLEGWKSIVVTSLEKFLAKRVASTGRAAAVASQKQQQPVYQLRVSPEHSKVTAPDRAPYVERRCMFAGSLRQL